MSTMRCPGCKPSRYVWNCSMGPGKERPLSRGAMKIYSGPTRTAVPHHGPAGSQRSVDRHAHHLLVRINDLVTHRNHGPKRCRLPAWRSSWCGCRPLLRRHLAQVHVRDILRIADAAIAASRRLEKSAPPATDLGRRQSSGTSRSPDGIDSHSYLPISRLRPWTSSPRPQTCLSRRCGRHHHVDHFLKDVDVWVLDVAVHLHPDVQGRTLGRWARRIR